MKKAILILMVIGFALIGCRDNSEPKAVPDVLSNTNTKSVTKHAKQGRANSYLGCWSSANGNFMIITDDKLQTRNSYKALSYKDISDQAQHDDDEFLIQILDKDESREFAYRIEKIKILPNEEMDVSKYQTLLNLNDTEGFSKMARWVRSDCKLVED